jgi:hypothetical protein
VRGGTPNHHFSQRLPNHARRRGTPTTQQDEGSAGTFTCTGTRDERASLNSAIRSHATQWEADGDTQGAVGKCSDRAMAKMKTVAVKTRPGACGTRLTPPSQAIKTSKAHKKLALAATIKKKRRWRPGTVALREIRKYAYSSPLYHRLASFRVRKCMRRAVPSYTCTHGDPGHTGANQLPKHLST